MFGGPLFEVALVLLFVFVAMSALVSVIQETIVQIFRMRSGNLRRGITELLSDKHYKDEIAKRFYRHPMISSLGKSGSRMTRIESSAFLHALASAIQPIYPVLRRGRAPPAAMFHVKQSPSHDQRRPRLVRRGPVEWGSGSPKRAGS